MNLPALSSAIVHAILNSRGDCNHNLATVVQNMISEAMEKKSEPPMRPLFSTPKELSEFQAKANEAIAKVVHENNLRIEQLTESQCTQAIIQAFQSGDFKRLVRVSDNAQQVVYLPFAEREALKARIMATNELLARFLIAHRDTAKSWIEGFEEVGAIKVDWNYHPNYPYITPA